MCVHARAHATAGNTGPSAVVKKVVTKKATEKQKTTSLSFDAEEADTDDVFVSKKRAASAKASGLSFAKSSERDKEPAMSSYYNSVCVRYACIEPQAVLQANASARASSPSQVRVLGAFTCACARNTRNHHNILVLYTAGCQLLC